MKFQEDCSPLRVRPLVWVGLWFELQHCANTIRRIGLQAIEKCLGQLRA